ncbi:MAG: S9 family peptidase [Candidatus Polarisedimenticolia bacterium]
MSRPLWIASLALAAVSAVPAEAAGTEITLRDVFPNPPLAAAPSAFQWSPDGSRLAWLQADPESGTPLLRLRPMGKGAPVALTREQEGPFKMSVGAFVWSPSGNALVAVSEGDLFLFEIPASGDPTPPRRLTRTSGEEQDPRYSPDGRWIGFVRDGDLYVIDPSGATERRLTRRESDDVLNGAVDWVYEEEFSLDSGWWWSPDSRRVAYLQLDQKDVPRYPIVDLLPVHADVTWQRYPKAGDPNPVPRLGVVEVAGESDAVPPTRWMDVGADKDIYLPRAGWTQAGRVAIQRLDRDQTHLDMLTCDARSGACATLLTESDPHWINIDDAWRFLKDGLLWGSERDGYRHLYVHPLDGGPARRLTSGSWVVTGLEQVDEAGGWVHFTATEKDPRERHLYRVRLDGTGFSRLTREEGTHNTLVAPGGKAFLDTFSTALTPPTVTLRGGDGDAREVLDDAEARRVAGLRLGQVEYHQVPASDGTSLPALLIKPQSFDPSRKYPVLVYVYGGPHAQMVIRGWMGWRALWLHMMADRGVMIWMLDNRGAAGRGHAWETPVHRRMGRQELADQLEGVAYLRALRGVDPDRIGIWGWSYGGYMTLYALTNAPGTFRLGVSVAPVTDWKNYDTIYTERYMDRPTDNEDGYRESAPLTKASALRDPLLLVHGSADDNVHLTNSAQMLDALASAEIPVEFMLYPGKGHGIAGPATRRQLFEKITDFILENL